MTRKKRSLAKHWADVSLRNKITGVTVLILLLGLAVAGAGTTSLLRPVLHTNHDRELQQIKNDPVSALQPGANTGSLSRADVLYAPGRNYVAMFDAEGNFLYDNNTGENENNVPEVSDLSLDAVIEETSDDNRAPNQGIFTFTADNGTNWRAIIAPVYTPDSHQVTGYLLVASSTALIDTLIAQYITIFAGFGIAVVLLGAALTRILVSATFEPLSEVERTAREIARGDFSKRIHVRSPNTEVGHVGTSLNVMLDNINTAFDDRAKTIEKMRRFIGDAGHELRTPLASVRGYAEMYRMGMLKEDEHIEQAMDRIEKEAIRMTSLVEDLLSLARLDASRELDMVPLDLNALARDAALDAGAQAPDRTFTAITSVDTPMALGDEHKVRQVMTNLLGNAIRHTDPGDNIEVAVISLPDRARFEIRDHGEGVPEAIREKIFDRFWRADTSRNRETGGSGLGLAIVTSIVEAHSGTVSCHETPGGGATFRVDLPLAQADPDSDTETTGASAVFEAGLEAAEKKGTEKKRRRQRRNKTVENNA